MKKLFFSLIIGLFGFINFSIAGFVNFSYNGSSFNPSSFDFSDGISNYDFSTDSSVRCIVIFDSRKCRCRVQFNWLGDGIISNQCSSVSCSGIMSVEKDVGTCDGFSFKLKIPDPPFLSGGVSNFSGVISGLGSSVNEFIPYVVYIGIGILVFSIGFVAILWLMRWLYFKVLNIFK